MNLDFYEKKIFDFDMLKAAKEKENQNLYE